MKPTPGVQLLIHEGMTRQLKVFTLALAAGMPRLGWKIGINDPAAQQRFGLNATLVGWLDGRRVFPNGATYSPPPNARPRIEAEVAITLSRDVAKDAPPDEARAAIASIAPAIEFVNASKPLTPLDDLLAFDILHDGVLFGDEAPPAAATGLVAKGLPAVSLNGAQVRLGQPNRYPDDLGEIVSHVASVLAKHGQSLQAGDRIIGGSYIDPFDVAPGDRVEADFGELGKLSFTVA